MILTGAYGLVLADAPLPSPQFVQRRIDARPCLFTPTLLAIRTGGLAGRIRVHKTIYNFGCEVVPARDVVAPAHAALLTRWTHAFVFRDDGSTIGASLSAMVAEATAQAAGGAIYDRERGVMPGYGDLIHRLDAYLAAAFDEAEAYFARYPDERPVPSSLAYRTHIEAKVFPGRP